MKPRIKWLVAFLLALTLLSAVTALADTIYFPQVEKHPTYTPTPRPTVTRTPTRTPTPKVTATPKPGVYIVDIYYDPPIIFPLDELNEYIEIENTSSSNVNLGGWFIRVESIAGPEGRYEFPSTFVLREDRTVKVWTGLGEDTSTDLYWGQLIPRWKDNRDCGYLRDEEDVKDVYCYPEDESEIILQVSP